MVVTPGNPSASISCAITPVSSPLSLSFQVNVLPLIALILSSAFGITLMFSLRLISEEANAVMSPPTCNAPLIPTPPATVTAPVVLLDDA